MATTRTRPLTEPQARVIRVLSEQPHGTAWESTIRFLVGHHYGAMPTPANMRQTLDSLERRELIEPANSRRTMWRVRPGVSA